MCFVGSYQIKYLVNENGRICTKSMKLIFPTERLGFSGSQTEVCDLEKRSLAVGKMMKVNSPVSTIRNVRQSHLRSEVSPTWSGYITTVLPFLNSMSERLSYRWAPRVTVPVTTVTPWTITSDVTHRTNSPPAQWQQLQGRQATATTNTIITSSSGSNSNRLVSAMATAEEGYK